MYHGILNVYKEKGYTSHDVVAKLRGITGQKKIGHTGTLDPAAEGVLPVCLGKGTKLCEALTDHDKAYEAVLLLGTQTDTQDMTGKVLKVLPVEAGERQIRDVFASFVGEITQIPPMYSAIRQNGRRLYELARAGVSVERAPRRIVIDELQISELSLPYVRFSVTCSKGTYIRTLCADIGEKLGCGGCMQSLLRTRVGQLQIADSLTLSKLAALTAQNRLQEALQTIDSFFASLPAVSTDAAADAAAHNGNAVEAAQTVAHSGGAVEAVHTAAYTGNAAEADGCGGGQVRLYDSASRFVGVFSYDEKKRMYRPDRMFYYEE